MPSLVRPRREISFSDWVRNHPREPIPADRLDAQIANLIDAITSLQDALSDVRRDDGGLKNQTVGLEQLKLAVHAAFTGDVAEATAFNARRAEQGAAVVKASERTAQLFAKDAEAAAISAAQFLSAVNTAKQLVDQHNNRITALADVVDAEATDAENWGKYAHAQADNAIKAQQEALAWAEYLAGPVVNADDAPAYIADSPFPHGLYYQPVEGYGGMAGLWSAKWWAVYAAQLVGPWGFYYLGGWSSPPLPGAVNPETGVKVPNPLAPGSFYYDTELQSVFVWTGSEWASPYSLASGITSKFVYQATAGQIDFAGADLNGAIPDVGLSPSDVHLNGVRLVEGVDYTVDSSISMLTLVDIAVTAGSIVQWDLLVPPDDLVPGNVNNFKVALTPPVPDGTVTEFTMQYTHPINGPMPVNVTHGAQLQVSLDGVIQEPGVDYAASDDTLTLSVAPRADTRLWVVWFSNAVLTS